MRCTRASLASVGMSVSLARAAACLGHDEGNVAGVNVALRHPIWPSANGFTGGAALRSDGRLV